MPIRDGTKSFLGVDTETDVRRPGYLKRVVNRTFRNYANKTRPPFSEIDLVFYDKEDENVYRNGAVTGMCYYRGIRNKTNAFLIVAVNDRILAGMITPDSIIFYPAIHKGINIDRQNSFFCKAEDILVFQNGKDYPLFWRGGFNGAALSQMKPVYESSFVQSFPMMVGNIMVYCHGRIFIATENDLVYASDHIYSQGISLDSNEAILRFQESTYPSGGDGFGATSDMDQITGLSSVKKIGALTGHGEVFALCRNGAFSIDPTPVRSQWTAQSIQKTLFIGKGCSAYDSVLNIGDDIMYRDSDGHISSIKFSSNQNSAEYESDSMSQDVDLYLSYDNNPLIGHSKSVLDDGRALFTCVLELEESILGGTHIFSNAIVPIDFSRTENRFRFEGIWTGPRVTHCCNIFSGGTKLSVFSSFDTDKQNRLYRLDKKGSGDFSNGKKLPIVSMYLQNNLFHSTEINDVSTKKVKKQDVIYKDATGKIKIKSSIAKDGSSCFKPLLKEVVKGTDGCMVFGKDGCGIKQISSHSGSITSENACSDIQSAVWYDLLTEVEGNVTIVSDVLSGEQDKTETSYSAPCEKEESCCDERQTKFNNQF